MSEKINQPLEETRLEQSLECNAQGKYMSISSVPFNLFRMEDQKGPLPILPL